MRQISKHATLLELRVELAARLGYAAQGSQGDVLKSKLNYYLKDAHDQLLYQFDDMLRKGVVDDKIVNSGQALYDVDNAAEADTIRDVYIWYGAVWTRLKRGIPFQARDSVSSGVPSHWQMRLGTTDQGQIELWPVPASEYKIGYEYQALANNFNNDTDRSSVPSRMVFLMAASNAMTDYGKPGADRLLQQVDMMLGKLRARQTRGTVIHGGKARHTHGQFPWGDVEFVAKQAEFVAP